MRTLLLIGMGLLYLTSNANAQTALNQPAIALTPIQELAPTTTTQTGYHFDLNGGLMFVEAAIGSDKDSFILDTGAPTLVMNSAKINSDKPLRRAVGLSGTMKIQTMKVKDFSLNTIKKKKIEVMAADISHLERVKGRKIKGLIGYEALKDHEMVIDYETQKLTFLEEGDVRKVDGMIPIEQYKLKIRQHLAVVKVKIGKKNYLFGVDTGAEVNVIDIDLYKKLKKHCQGDKTEKYLQGVDKGKTRAIATKIKKTQLKGTAFKDMDYVFADISFLNRGYALQLDGILGYPFLKQAKFSINYKTKRLSIWQKVPDIDKLLEVPENQELLTADEVLPSTIIEEKSH